MKLHANARTCPNSRAARSARAGAWLVARGGGRGRRRERAHCAKWVAVRARVTVGCSTAPLRPGASRRASRPSGSRRSGAAAAAHDRRRDRGDASAWRSRRCRCWLKRIGLGKRSRLEPPEPPNRYERRQPGELVHVDIKKLGRFSGAGHRVIGNRARASKTTRPAAAAASTAGNTCTSASTTTHASPTPRCSPTSAARRAAAFLRRARGLVRRTRRQGRAGDDRQRLRLRLARSRRAPAPSSACATCAPAPTARAPTARPSASSRRCSTTGPTRASTAARPSAPQPPPGSSTTTTDDHTAPSATRLRPRG